MTDKIRSATISNVRVELSMRLADELNKIKNPVV